MLGLEAYSETLANVTGIYCCQCAILCVGGARLARLGWYTHFVLCASSSVPESANGYVDVVANVPVSAVSFLFMKVFLFLQELT